MRAALAALLLLCPTLASAQGDCLSPGDVREVVAAREIVQPVVAIRAARRAAPGAEITRAHLCRQQGGYVYVINALGRDGRFVEVRIDAQSGKLSGQ